MSWGLQFLHPFQTPLYLHSLCCKIHGKGASPHPHISSKGAAWSPKVALAGARDQNFTYQTCTHHMSHTTPQEHSLHLCDIPGASPQDTGTCLPFPTPPGTCLEPKRASLRPGVCFLWLPAQSLGVLTPASWTDALCLYHDVAGINSGQGCRSRGCCAAGPGWNTGREHRMAHSWGWLALMLRKVTCRGLHHSHAD